MAKRKGFDEKVTQTELIVCAFEKYDSEIREWEAKKTGAPDADEMIERYIRPFRNKCDILNTMYEFETGTKLFEE